MRSFFRRLRRKLKDLIHEDFDEEFIMEEDEQYLEPSVFRFYPVIYELTVELDVSITGSDVDDIICMALDGGIDHWCYKVEAKAHWPSNTMAEQITKFGTLVMHDKDDNVHELTLPMVLYGIRVFLKNCKSIERNKCGRIDICDIGKHEADEIIQYALFNEIIYK